MSQAKAKQVFDTCRAVVKTDQNLALYLLPHVAVQVLLDGTQVDHDEVFVVLSVGAAFVYSIT